MTRTAHTAIERNKRSYIRYLYAVDKARLKNGKRVFPMTADDLIAYIKFRATTSAFRTIQWYIHSLHYDPLHGPDWRRDVYFHPRVTEVLEDLRERDRAAGIPLYTLKNKDKVSANATPKKVLPFTNAGPKKDRIPIPAVLSIQPKNMTNKVQQPDAQQGTTMTTTTPQIPEPQPLASSDADSSHAVHLDLHRIQRRIRLVNYDLPVTWS